MSERVTGLASFSRPTLRTVLESAARLQEVVPDAVLVGGSAASMWADHRVSLDHDHVLADLSARYGAVLEAVEATDGWVTNRLVPGKLILGELGGIETGIRQMIRSRPLEAVEVELPSGHRLTAPTPEETIRVKAFLIVRRNRVRDYLDLAALSDAFGVDESASILADIDLYYADQHGEGSDGVSSQLVRQLSDPRPSDPRAVRELVAYKELDPRWTWDEVARQCRHLALEVVAAGQ